MKVAVITEGSTKHRNADVVAAAESLGLEVLNLGMKNEPDEPDLSYLETAFLSALVLNLKVVDFVLRRLRNRPGVHERRSAVPRDCMRPAARPGRCVLVFAGSMQATASPLR